MTTEYKITRTDLTPSPASQAGADASQNRELMQGIEQTLDRMNAPANDAHTPDWYLAPGSLKNEHFLIVAGHSVAKVRTSNQRVLELIAAAPETAAERDRLKLENKRLIRERETGWGPITSQRDQAREQVKTLLAACKFVIKYDGHKLGSIGEAVLKSAIVSVESEQVK